MSIYVLTCAREGAPSPYVLDTCRAIDREGTRGDRVLVVDLRGEAKQAGDVAASFAELKGWRVVGYLEPHLPGNKAAYWHCLELAAAAGTEALVFEDDVTFCRNAVRRMELFPVPDDLGLVQFFAPRVLPVAQMPPGLWRPPSPMYYFTQAIKFTADCVRRLVDWKARREWGKFNESDRALALGLVALRIRHGVHAPELVQHVGEVSAAEPGATLRARTAHTFPGPEFDALSLFAHDELYR